MEDREWRKRKNAEPETLFQNTNMVDVIRKQRLHWAGDACNSPWRNRNKLIKTVIEQKTVGRPKTRCENLIKKNVEFLGGGSV